MAEIVSVIRTKCIFCGKNIDWDAEFMVCPECDGTMEDPYTGCICPYCLGDGFIESDEYLPCCNICFEQEYGELEGEEGRCLVIRR